MSTNNINNKSKYSLRTIAKILLKIALFFIVIGVLIGVFASGAGAGYFASLVKDEPIASYDEMKSEIYNYEETSKFILLIINIWVTLPPHFNEKKLI